MTLGTISVDFWTVRLISDHQVEVTRLNSPTFTTYRSYNDLPINLRHKLEESGMASQVEQHLACSVS
jgi:hypothetical protein